MSWVVSKLLDLQCKWKVQNHTQGPHKETIHNLSPKKNYLCNNILNACDLVTGNAVLPD